MSTLVIHFIPIYLCRYEYFLTIKFVLEPISLIVPDCFSCLVVFLVSLHVISVSARNRGDGS
jgi:hypothetical protein